jgi:hypothetical protein
LNNVIAINNKIQESTKLVAPFLKQLSLFDSCQFATMELLWKYYRALHTSSQCKRLRQQQKSTMLAKKQSSLTELMLPFEDVIPDDPKYLLSLVWSELIDDNIDAFVSVVDNAYRQSFEQLYSGFFTVGGYLSDLSQIQEMYELLMSMFPFVHLVLALTVLAPQGEQVGLSQVLSVDDDHTNDGKCDDRCDRGRLFFINGPKDKSATSDKTVDVSHRERAVLDFFIAKIRICSRRKLRYWAMVPPLGSHSRGHMRNASSHPLHGAGCLPTPL